MAWRLLRVDLVAAPLQATAVGTGMGLGFGLVLVAPVLAPVLTLAHATDRGPGGGHFAGTVLPVLLLGIVTHPVIQLVMLVAAHLRAYSTGGGTRSCTANPATDMGSLDVAVPFAALVATVLQSLISSCICWLLWPLSGTTDCAWAADAAHSSINR